MKLATAVVKPFKLDEVRAALLGPGPAPHRFRPAAAAASLISSGSFLDKLIMFYVAGHGNCF